MGLRIPILSDPYSDQCSGKPLRMIAQKKPRRFVDLPLHPWLHTMGPTASWQWVCGARGRAAVLCCWQRPVVKATVQTRRPGKAPVFPTHSHHRLCVPMRPSTALGTPWLLLIASATRCSRTQRPLCSRTQWALSVAFTFTLCFSQV